MCYSWIFAGNITNCSFFFYKNAFICKLNLKYVHCLLALSLFMTMIIKVETQGKLTLIVFKYQEQDCSINNVFVFHFDCVWYILYTVFKVGEEGKLRLKKLKSSEYVPS